MLIRLLIINLFFSCSIFCQKIYTLEDCISLAISNSVLIKKNSIDHQYVNFQKKQVRLKWLPKFNYQLYSSQTEQGISSVYLGSQ